MSRTHLWRGQPIDDATLERLLPQLRAEVDPALGATLPLPVLLGAADRLHGLLESRSEPFEALKACLEADGLSSEEAGDTLDLLAASLARPTLEERRVRGLGADDSLAAPRLSGDGPVYATWAPLGLVVVLPPRRPAWMGVEAALDALLAGNVAFVCAHPEAGAFTHRFIEVLAGCDPTGLLPGFAYVATLDREAAEPLRCVMAVADGVAAWGDDGTLPRVRALAPPRVPLIEHPAGFSVAWVSRDRLEDLAALEPVARECCRWEQQAPWSPHVVYVDTDDPDDVERFAVLFGSLLNDASLATPPSLPPLLEQAAITTLAECWRLEGTLAPARGVIEGIEASWRLLVDADARPVVSPRFRTVHVKPLAEEQIVEVLGPFGHALHTAMLVCAPGALPRVSRLFALAGARRIGPPALAQRPAPFAAVGEAAGLRRLVRAVAVVGHEGQRGVSVLSDLWSPDPGTAGAAGTGSVSLWSDPAQEARSDAEARARALVSAGLDPTRERCLLVPGDDPWDPEEASVRAALDHLGVAWTWPRPGMDEDAVAALLEGAVDVLVGRQDALMDLLELVPLDAETCSVRRILLLGPAPEDGGRPLLEQWLGPANVRSAGYWRSDAGLLGFACAHTPPGVFHLRPEGWRAHAEVPAEDGEPVEEVPPGRLVFTSGDGRFQVGTDDWGHVLVEACPCGRHGGCFVVLEPLALPSVPPTDDVGPDGAVLMPGESAEEG